MNYLFYEDTKVYKRFYLILTILFYIGFIFGVGAIIIYHIIKPEEMMQYYNLYGSEFIITPLCLVVAIISNVLIIKLNYFNQSVSITYSEIIIKRKSEQMIFQTKDLLSFRITYKYLFYKEYTLLFKEKRSISIISNNRSNIQDTLNSIIKENDSSSAK